ncbi:hypothetical protein BOTBODRAFT_171398 [Botryobasidium botryosum FD-172 SS1]|uniref:Protein kinase domain-containing protein n=1 Tax=Botryobasidium botryosum (strain FD-172 SS1) TaxID=930990 RepID=A0A067MV48_BOTB1|nr:hypothetical protein BOTBODRAFT_171398 [Botryobasidium botryosum FD-172 SS1]
MSHGLFFPAIGALSVGRQISRVPDLGVAHSILKQIELALKSIRCQTSQYKALVERSKAVVSVIELHWNPEEAKSRAIDLDNLAKHLRSIHGHMVESAGRTLLQAILHQSQVSAEIRAMMNRLNSCLEPFQLLSELEHMDNSVLDWGSLTTVLSGLQRFPRDRIPLNVKSIFIEEPPDVDPHAHYCEKVGRNPVIVATNNDIYEGRWMGSEKVALKIVRLLTNEEEDKKQRIIERLPAEVKIWAELRSQYIAPLYATCTDDGPYPYMVVPWYRNGDATKYVRSKPTPIRVRICLEIAYGLQYLHSLERPVIYGNLKGSNVLISDEEGALLSDFAHSSFSGESDGPNMHYLRWMSPEAQRGQRTPDIDIWAWAMTTLELLSDMRPFHGLEATNFDLSTMIERGLLPNRDNYQCDAVDDDMWSLLESCWQKPHHRPTIAYIVEEMEQRSRLIQENALSPAAGQFHHEEKDDDEFDSEVRQAVERGDINDQNADGETILHRAIRSATLPAVVSLLSAGADVHLRNKHGGTPLHMLHLRERRQWGDVSERTKAIPDILKALLGKGVHVDIADRDGQTPLQLAASAGARTTITALLNAGASVHACDKDGKTALHLATAASHADACMLLLQAGAFITKHDNSSDTPVMNAVRKRSTETLNILLRYSPSSSKGISSTLESEIFRAAIHIREDMLDQGNGQRFREKNMKMLSIIYAYTGLFPSAYEIWDYEVEKADPLVERGGFGNCYRGVLWKEHQVALKCLRVKASQISTQDQDAPASMDKYIKRELHAWRRLKHRRILPLISTCTLSDNMTYMISPWMHHGSILAYLELEQYQDVDRLLLLMQIGEGLQYLHEFDPPIVHGDVRGHNILISESGEACLADFGLSLALEEVSFSNSSNFHHGGNARWMAPELMAHPPATRSAASDVFSFGRAIVEGH